MSSLNNAMDFNNKITMTIGVIVVLLIMYNIYYKSNDNETEYGVLCESFSQTARPPHERIPGTCIAGIDYSNSNDMICRNWYNRNVLGVEYFSSNDFSQDTIINTVFSMDKVNFPFYCTPFKKIPDIADPCLTYRTSCYIMTSVDHIHWFMKSVFSKLKHIVDTSTKSFDPYVATCSIQITLASLLFEIYRNIANSFFSLVCNVESPPHEATVPFLYLMPFMMFLKQHITGLMEGAMIVLTKNNNKSLLVDVSTINPNVYNNVKTQMENEISNIFTPSLLQNTSEEELISKCINSEHTSEFNEYRTIIVSALTSVLSLCRSKVKTIDSLTTNNHVIQTIINGDLIHVFYRAVLYFTEVLSEFCDNVSTKNDTILKHYEWETHQLMTTATQTPLFTSTNESSIENNISIDTALSSFNSPQSLRIAMINIANSIDISFLNILAKYTPPNRVGTLFMQLLNSKSEILAMPINQAKDYIVDYITSLSDSYLQPSYI